MSEPFTVIVIRSEHLKDIRVHADNIPLTYFGFRPDPDEWEGCPITQACKVLERNNDE